MIELVSKNTDERQSILKEYIEGDHESPRRPTQAHLAIARLVKECKIKVLITTNFDRLLEFALSAEGINPQIIDSDDKIKGAKPIAQSDCTLVKLNRDYLDTRIKNTIKELEKYSSKLNKYLDRILDEHGLIVVGWSGDWDTALHGAILRAPNRRYSLYWAAYQGDIGGKGKGLVEHRDGRVIDIESADRFFQEIGEKVRGLDRLKSQHPYSVNIALGLAKKYCRDDQYAMEWAELLNAELSKVHEYVTNPDFQACLTQDQLKDVDLKN